MQPLRLSHFSLVTALGRGLGVHREALHRARTGLAPCHFEDVDLKTWCGEVEGLDRVSLPSALHHYDCRNNRLAELCLQQDGLEAAVVHAAARYGASRVAVFQGTSTSGILQTELAYRRRAADGSLPADFNYQGSHNNASLAGYLRDRLQLSGPAMVVSTACSSSAKVFGSAVRAIEAGVVDAALVGGVDSLCLTTLYGFNSLELVSDEPCRPYDAERKGLSIGEAAAFVLLERAQPGDDEDILLLGVGESSDAHHMSAPHPEGLGARLAMEQALATADLTPAQIDYLNLHGTATRSNDAAEGRAVLDLFGTRLHCSSTKGATGHTLGAAGGVEAVFCALALQLGFMPGSPGTCTLDPDIPLAYLREGRSAPLHRVMSNSFGFGGSNCSLVFGKGAR